MMRLKEMFAFMCLVTLAMQFGFSNIGYAAFVPGVVINEVAWAGSSDGTSDEWIELYNAGSSSVDLSGWYIEDDGSSKYIIESGVIAPKGYFLIEDSEIATNIIADAVIGISLANAGDSLILKDAGGVMADSVNASGVAWPAGSSTPKASMERIDPSLSSVDNWASALSGSAKGRDGGAILGTPSSVNSNYGGDGAEVSLAYAGVAKNGDVITVGASVASAVDLYAYGFEVAYDPAVLKFDSAVEGAFLGADSVSTAFSSALVGEVEGKVVIGGARLQNPPQGIDGSGKLFDLKFLVIGSNGDLSDLVFSGENFVSDSASDVPAKMAGVKIEVGDIVVDKIEGLAIKEATKRFALELNWSAMDGVSSYKVSRMAANGSYVNLGSTSEIIFIDEENILPGVSYTYQVVAVKAGALSPAVEIIGNDSRGLNGDIDKSDRVDGRDIEKLARAYGSEYADEEYVVSVDVNFDGFIDGKDLIAIGANFGLKY